MPPRGQSEEAITTAIAFCRRKLRGLAPAILANEGVVKGGTQWVFAERELGNREGEGQVYFKNYGGAGPISDFQGASLSQGG